MPNERISKSPAEWIALARKGKEEWNRNIASWTDDCECIDFRNTEISDGEFFVGFRFPLEVDFTNAVFGPNVYFARVKFEGHALFCDAKFTGGAVFNFSSFLDDVSFRDCQFSEGASFHGTKFGNNIASFAPLTSFANAIFKGEARFCNAEFKGLAYFRESEFEDIANFYGAIFSDVVVFESAIFHQAPWFKRDVFPEDISFNHSNRFSKQFLDVKGKFAESNYREMKLAMKSRESHAEENAFFRQEMLARKHKEPWPKKGLYWLYEFVSDYGQSIARPLGWLVVFFGIFFGLYWGFPQLLGNGNMPDDHISNALHLAMQKAFVFPGMFSGTRLELSGWGTLLAGVHWLLSAASWFLMLLGLRNRFRLK